MLQAVTTRTHNDAHGTPVVQGSMVSVLGARPVKVQRLHGEGQFVFLRAGVEVTQFCCTAQVVPAPITGQSGAWLTWPAQAATLELIYAKRASPGRRGPACGEVAGRGARLSMLPDGNHGETLNVVQA